MIWLDTARIIAAFAVVFLHCAAAVVTGNQIGTENWWIGNIYDSLARWCVPVFVMISGALLLDVNKHESIKKFYIKRLSRILIPTIFWTAFFIVFDIFRRNIKGEHFEYTELIKNILYGRPYFHMWFLYMIIFMYIFTPFFRKIVKYSSAREMLVLIMLLFVMTIINNIYEIFNPTKTVFSNLFLPYTSYFFLGYFIRDRKEYPSVYPLLLIFSITTILTAVGYFYFCKNGLGFYFCGSFSITVIPMSISIFYLLKTIKSPICNSNIIRLLSSLTFGIYLIHPIFIDIIRYIFRHTSTMSNQLIIVPFLSFIIFILSMILSFLIKRIKFLNRII